MKLADALRLYVEMFELITALVQRVMDDKTFEDTFDIVSLD